MENGVPFAVEEGSVGLNPVGAADLAAAALSYGVLVGGRVAVTKNGVELAVSGAEIEILHEVKARIVQSRNKTKMRMC
jgi:hypothetical protein